ncbi:hypothetical protein [Grimontia sp. NTOU-MAR1]|uniref:hypothetical protein n=1 Tax=Grimontia sp. NTOU-MAR1 TaxID=3111011 RepID=UPI002DB97C71|nr:hypothetical protein [Grimontia sp. NTOU-MAR1]WRV96536.1 hypothetical protein VP504_10500 [Grimontia sp. NTOU-MAR1]
MEFLTQILENPVVGAVGYVLSLIAACIAIHQAYTKSVVKKEVVTLQKHNVTLLTENRELKIKVKNILNKNTVSQGDRSQYFQENSGPVTIDMGG